MKHHKPQQGLSLVELMIALALSSMLSLALFEVFKIARDSFKQVTDANEMLDSAQLSFALLQDSINMAGFWGGASTQQLTLISEHLSAYPGECDASWVLNVERSIEGFDGRENVDDINGLPKGCLSNDYIPNSDVLIVRRASVLDPIPENKIDNKYYRKRYIVRSSAEEGAVIFRGADAALAQGRMSESASITNRLLSIDMYYLEYCKDAEVCDDSGLSLSRYTLSGSRFVKQRLVNGVAQMQFEYGYDSSGDGLADQYITAEKVLNWKNVLSVRMFVLLRGKSKGGVHRSDLEEFALGESFLLELNQSELAHKYRKYQSEFSLRNS